MKESNEPQTTFSPRKSSTKTQVVRDTLVFQVKLFGDGMRDVFLSPVSIMAAVAGLLFSPSKPDYYLRKLMAFGHKSDRWLNLFGSYGDHATSTKKNSDAYVKKVEDMLLKGIQTEASSQVAGENQETKAQTNQKRSELTEIISDVQKTHD